MNSAHRHIAGRRRTVRSGRVRRRQLGLAGTLLFLSLAVALVMPIPSLGGQSVAVAAIQHAKSFIELMHQRSPGKRLVGHLVKTKHKKLAAHERALPKIRKPAPQMASMPALPKELPPALLDLVAPPLPVEFASLESMPVGPFQTPILAPGFYMPSTGGFIVPPGESPSPPVVTPPVVVPLAVPEPATWLMMLLGMGIIGWSLRGKPKSEQIAA